MGSFVGIPAQTGANFGKTSTTQTGATRSLSADVPAGQTRIVVVGFNNSGTDSPVPQAETGWVLVGVGYTLQTNADAGCNVAVYARQSTMTVETPPGFALDDSGSILGPFDFSVATGAWVIQEFDFDGLDLSTLADVTTGTSTGQETKQVATGGIIFNAMVTESATPSATFAPNANPGSVGTASTSGGGDASNISIRLACVVSTSPTNSYQLSCTHSDGAWVRFTIAPPSGPATYQVSATHAAASALVAGVTARLQVAATHAAASAVSGSPTVVPAGPTIYQVAATHAAASAVSGSPVARLQASSAAAAASAVSGSPVARLQASSAAAAASALVAGVTARLQVSATHAAASAVSGSPTVVGQVTTYQVSATHAAASALVAGVTARLQASSAAAAASALVAGVTARLQVAATHAAASAVSGSPTIVTTTPPAAGYWGIPL